MKHLSGILGMAMITSTLPAFGNQASWTTGVFDMPESALYDPAHDRIVLSVIGGHPGQADGNGALALLSKDGVLLDLAWTEGLDAPKGMAIVGDTLLVADLTRLHEVDLATGALLRSLDVEGAVFLNDITSDGQRAFVSDLMANRIWVYSEGGMRPWLDGDVLGHPNGLLLDGDRLLVGSWGHGLRDDFSTEQPGSLLAVDLSDQRISVLAENVGNIDGIARIGQALLLNDWITGQLFEVGEDGTLRETAHFAPGLADIAAFEEILLLPSMLEGTISAQTYPPTAP